MAYTNYSVVPATIDHIKNMLPRVRDIDAVELRAASGRDVEGAVQVSLAGAERAFSAIDSDTGNVILMWGVGDISFTVNEDLRAVCPLGCPWLVTTDLIEDKGRQWEFIKHSKEYADSLGSGFRFLVNMVHERNDLAIRWLKWLGFSFEESKRELLNGEPFISFWKEGC